MLGGAGAVAATQFGPWTHATDPDYLVTRDWQDTAGRYLGSCESHVRIDHLEPGVRGEAVRYLDTLDLDALEPDPDYVAGYLHALGRFDDVSRLVADYRPDPEPRRACRIAARRVGACAPGLLPPPGRAARGRLRPTAHGDPGEFGRRGRPCSPE